MPRKGSGRGFRIQQQGYIQITRRGPWRWWYEHRRVMWEALLEMSYYPIDRNHPALPAGMTVEHLDHNRSHNCTENLMLLDKRIHDHISWLSIRAQEEAPAWVTQQEEETECSD